MAKVYKVSFYLVDTDDSNYDRDGMVEEVERVLDRNDYMNDFIEVKASKSFEWDDDLALNQEGCSMAVYEEYLKYGEYLYMDRVELTKERIEELYNEEFVENRYCENKYTWFAEYFLGLSFDDYELAKENGKYLYEMCLDIHNHNNNRFYPDNENYSKDMMFKNLLEKCGLWMDCGVSYRQAWFDYYCDDRMIKDEETMDWLLNDLMGENDDE